MKTLLTIAFPVFLILSCYEFCGAWLKTVESKRQFSDKSRRIFSDLAAKSGWLAAIYFLLAFGALALKGAL